MSASQDIKYQIISKITPLDSVEVVYPAETLNPSGWPAVCITARREEGEFSSNAENSRIYEYNCIVLFPLGQDFVPVAERERMDYAEHTVAGVVDEIINAIDTDYELDSPPVLYVEAADTEWSYVGFEGGIARAATVTLRVYTEKVVV